MAATEAQKKAKAAAEQAAKETAEAKEAIAAADEAKAKAAKEIEEANKAVAEAKAAREKAIAETTEQDLTDAASTAADNEQTYRNAGVDNVFTEKGRVMPNETVNLSEEQALQYKGLEPCAKPESE